MVQSTVPTAHIVKKGHTAQELAKQSTVNVYHALLVHLAQDLQLILPHSAQIAPLAHTAPRCGHLHQHIVLSALQEPTLLLLERLLPALAPYVLLEPFQM